MFWTVGREALFTNWGANDGAKNKGQVEDGGLKGGLGSIFVIPLANNS